MFFHQYFTKKAEKEKAMAAKLKKRKEGKDDELDSDEDEQDSEGEDMDKDDEMEEDESELDEDNSELDEDEVWKVCFSFHKK